MRNLNLFNQLPKVKFAYLFIAHRHIELIHMIDLVYEGGLGSSVILRCNITTNRHDMLLNHALLETATILFLVGLPSPPNIFSVGIFEYILASMPDMYLNV